MTVSLGRLTDQHPEMLLLLVLGIFCATAAEKTVDETPRLNCTHVLRGEETTTEPPPTFPTTSFSCWGRYDGYYADIEVGCTIFHYCQTWYFPTGLNETVKWDFACPQSTIFNQRILSCTPPSMTFDCQESPNYYWVNYNLTATTTTTTPSPSTSPTAEFTTGHHLIVAGVGPQSAVFPSSDPPSTEQGLTSREPPTEAASDPVEIRFPL